MKFHKIIQANVSRYHIFNKNYRGTGHVFYRKTGRYAV